MPTDKNTAKIAAMREGGAVLAQIRNQLAAETKIGSTFAEIEANAQRLIKKADMKPSFSTVPGYSWATCIMKNSEMCHGIPTRHKRVDDGDIITIDVGLINKGFHLDTTITFPVGQITPQVQDFLNVGKKALKKAISRVKDGASVYDISYAMQHTVEKAGFDAVTQLTGHGVGEQLHMQPSIPCVALRNDKKVILKAGMTIAVEIMYSTGSAQLTVDRDGWTYKTIDGSLAAMYEDTVLVTETGFEVLTTPSTVE
ncbi:MAG: methionyl aminopeptidase [Patescibacteria group bacterium]|nr:methionyl aminopeptidase [Patescibacteria group bacterium]